MKRFLAFLGMMAFLFVLSMGVNLAQDQPLKFNRPEIESMMFLFNETTIKGSDIDVLAVISQKLKTGVSASAAFADTTDTIDLNLTPEEAQVCLNIINNATFQARFVDLVLGMKQKLLKLAPPQAPMFQTH